ncbi:MAG: hypothetical protein ACFBZ8_13745 [Opitutales bacterium]
MLKSITPMMCGRLLGIIALGASTFLTSGVAQARTLGDTPLPSQRLQLTPRLSTGNSEGNELPGGSAAEFVGRTSPDGSFLPVTEADLQRVQRVERARIPLRFQYERIGDLMVRLDTTSGDVAFLRIDGNQAIWENVLIDETLIGNRNPNYARYVQALANGK